MNESKEVKVAQDLKKLEEFRRTAMYLTALDMDARDRFAKFQAYQRAGFNASQALELVAREIRA